MTNTEYPGLWTCLCLALLSAGCASATIPRSTLNDVPERYRLYVLPPVDSFTAYNFDSWTPLSRNQLLISPRRDETYLVTVWEPCFELEFAQRIGISRATGLTVSKFDKVLVGRDESCPISEIRPVDLQKMKADLDRAKAGAPVKQ